MSTSDVPPGGGGASQGGEADRLFEAAYDELRRRAHHLLRRERSGHTLQTTELVHEAYAKLAGAPGSAWDGRTHFCRVAARAMRQVLVNWARDRAARKRGGEAPGLARRWRRMDLRSADELGLLPAEARSAYVLDLDAALLRLAGRWPRRARALEMAYFGGLTQQEVAAELGVVEKTVRRDLQAARAWLRRELGGEESRRGPGEDEA